MSGTLLSRCPLVAAALVLPLVMGGCGHGSKVQHGNNEVFYTEGATKAEADRLGAYLLNAPGGAAGPRRSVQLKKTADGYQFRMVVKKEFQNDEKILKGLQFEGARISRDVFDGAAVEVHACDEHLKTLKVLPPRADARYGVLEGKVEVFFAAAGDKQDAQRLAKHLVRLWEDAPTPVSFKLARRGEIVEVHMVVQQEQLKEPGVIAALQKDRNDIAVNVFENANVEMHLCDEFLDVIQVLKQRGIAPRSKRKQS